MKKLNLLLVVSLLIYGTTHAQTLSRGDAFENFGGALKLGILYGPGIDFSTSLHPNLKARLGFNYLGIDATKYIESSEEDNELEQGKLSFANVNLLFDFYPKAGSLFFITAGAYFGSNKISIAGNNFDPFSLNGNVIIPGANGYFKGNVLFGGAVKPYFGLGLGRTIPNKRVGFKFELGAFYQGKMKFESVFLDKSMNPADVDDDLDIPYVDSKFWPSLTFSLVFRIK